MSVKPKCTRGVVYHVRPFVHDAYMGKRPVKKATSRLRPMYQRTFILEWREFRSLSQEQLAEKVGEYLLDRGIKKTGYTHASIGRMERGKMPYSQPIMEGISDALRVPVEHLISQRPPALGQPEPPDQETLLRLWNEVSKTVRRQ